MTEHEIVKASDLRVGDRLVVHQHSRRTRVEVVSRVTAYAADAPQPAAVFVEVRGG